MKKGWLLILVVAATLAPQPIIIGKAKAAPGASISRPQRSSAATCAA